MSISIRNKKSQNNSKSCDVTPYATSKSNLNLSSLTKKPLKTPKCLYGKILTPTPRRKPLECSKLFDQLFNAEHEQNGVSKPLKEQYNLNEFLSPVFANKLRTCEPFWGNSSEQEQKPEFLQTKLDSFNIQVPKMNEFQLGYDKNINEDQKETELFDGTNGLSDNNFQICEMEPEPAQGPEFFSDMLNFRIEENQDEELITASNSGTESEELDLNPFEMSQSSDIDSWEAEENIFELAQLQEQTGRP